MYRQTDGRTYELIRVGLANLRFLQVNTAITTARVTIENFWRDAGETWARRGRELSQILTEELFILGIWECS